MAYALTPHTAPILKETMERFNFDDPPTDPIKLAYDLVETMIGEGGIGLSANQVGHPFRVFAIASDPCLVCFNPTIIDTSEEQVVLEEGCLSFPGIFVKVKRPKMIKVRFTQANGEVKTEKYTGMTARVFQHELDHLDGKTMLDRTSTLNRDRARKQMKKLSRKKEPSLGNS